MSLSDDFFNAAYSPNKVNDTMLRVLRQADSGTFCYNFDFTIRLVVVRTGMTASVVPFSQMDRDVLEKHWQKLVELGGNPPALTSTPMLDKPRFKPGAS